MGTGKTALMLSLCKHFRDTYSIAVGGCTQVDESS